MSTARDRVDDVRVSVAFAPAAEGPADEVFVLELRPSPREWEDGRYLDPLGDLVDGLSAGAEVPYVLSVCRRWDTEGSRHAVADVSLRLGRRPGRDDGAASRGAVLAVLRELARDGSPAPGGPVSRDDAVGVARRAVGTAFGVAAASGLAVAEEEHRPSQGRWLLGLVTADGIRFHVEVGLVDGNPSTVYVRRSAPAEVVDSVGDS